MSHFPRASATRSLAEGERRPYNSDTDTNLSTEKSIVETAKQQKAGEDRVLRQIFQWIPSARLDEDVLDALLQDKAARKSLPQATTVSKDDHNLARLKAAALLWLLYCFALPLSLIGMIFFMSSDLLRQERKSQRRGQKRQPRAPPTLKSKPTLDRGSGGSSGSDSSAFLHSDDSYRRGTNGHRGTALVSGGNTTRALHVCRHLHQAGWRVVLTETYQNWGCCTRFSRSVAQFYVTPRPERDPARYLRVMKRIAAKERVSLWVPVSSARHSLYDALAAELMPHGCVSCMPAAGDVARLGDGIKFAEVARRAGLAVPPFVPITAKGQLYSYNRKELLEDGRYLLKQARCSAEGTAAKLELPCSEHALQRVADSLDISLECPWLLQQALRGPRFSSYSVVSQGDIIAHADSLVGAGPASSMHVGSPEVLQWIQAFCAGTGLSGQLCFDFVQEAAGGRLCAIECRPFTGPQVLQFRGSPGFAAALSELGNVTRNGDGPLVPPGAAGPVFWVWQEVGRLAGGLLRLREPRDVLRWAREVRTSAATLANGREATFDPQDPMPFLALLFLQVPIQLAHIVLDGTPWTGIDLPGGEVLLAPGHSL